MLMDYLTCCTSDGASSCEEEPRMVFDLLAWYARSSSLCSYYSIVQWPGTCTP